MAVPETLGAVMCRLLTLLLLCRAAAAAVAASSAEDGAQDAGSLMNIQVFNSYTKDKPITHYPWELMAEPNRPTTMELLDWPEASDALDYQWVVDGYLLGYGRSIEVNFATLGKHTVQVEAFAPGPDKTIQTTLSTSDEMEVMVKYVRREVRALTDADREAFFNAVAVLQRVPTAVGQRMYGDKYFSKDYLTRLHLYYGGTKDCDHWHQGAGFVTSHVTLTTMFEQSLQSVNPRVTVPYWDFTLESTFYKPADWRQSPVFSSDWFGEATPANELRTMTKGRFAYVPAMTEAREFSSVTNSYGLLRSPWNNDPTPFTTRSDHVYGYENNMKPSGCAEYFIALRKTNWMAMAKQLNSAAHGHIHETVGGAWNTDFREASGGESSPSVMTVSHSIEALSKMLWRAGFVTCPDECAMDTPWQDCQCTCDAESIGDLTPFEVLRDAGLLKAVQFFDKSGHLVDITAEEDGSQKFIIKGYSEVQSRQIYKDMLHIMCQPGHIGTMFQASSTNDITFWVLHPTLDRLWHWKRLAGEDDATYDESWPAVDPCYGHNPGDQQPFKNVFDSDDRYYSNMELYDLLDPTGDTLPYVYDNFRWPHCAALGYSMSNLSVSDE